MLLLVFCVAPKCDHLFRMLPPDQVADLAEQIDALLHDPFCRILDLELTPLQARQLQFKVSSAAESWVVTKRYSEFVALAQALGRDEPEAAAQLPQLSTRTTLFTAAEKVVAERAKALSAFTLVGAWRRCNTFPSSLRLLGLPSPAAPPTSRTSECQRRQRRQSEWPGRARKPYEKTL